MGDGSSLSVVLARRVPLVCRLPRARHHDACAGSSTCEVRGRIVMLSASMQTQEQRPFQFPKKAKRMLIAACSMWVGETTLLVRSYFPSAGRPPPLS